MATITLPHNWQPRPYQVEAWKYLQSGGKHAELIWCRRAGKDDLALHRTAVAAFERVGTYWHMLPMASQAKRAIWNAVNPKTGKKRIDEAFPKEIRKKQNEQEMYIEFINGSTWQVLGSDNYNSMVGAPPVGIVYSEWALSNPAAKAYLRPILDENGGWQIFITTPRGRNHAHTTYLGAKSDPGAFAQILTAAETGQYTPGKLDELRGKYIVDFGEVIGSAMFEQEFMCSFDSPIVGAVYAKELRESKERTRSIPHDPSKKVHTFWDLGRRDKTCIWFVQIVGPEYRIIDYMEGVGKHIGEYAKALQSKKYIYGNCWLPHDANNELLASERTVAQQMRDFGFQVMITPKTTVAARIEAARLVFPMCWFDELKCQQGLEALINYRYEVNENKQYSNSPLHDWASHAADAFGYMAVAISSDGEHKKSVEFGFNLNQHGHHVAGSWMGM